MPTPRELQSLWDVTQRWHADLLEFLRSDAPKIIVIIVVAAILIKLLRMVTGRLARFTRSQELPSRLRAQQLRTLVSVVNGVGLFVILFMALLQILQVVNINIGPLLASAGVAGLAIGFGAQTLVKDVITGFFILMENQYDVGDVIKVAGVTGTVEHMTLRRTVLRDADGSLHTVPNSQISLVSNLTRDWTQTSLHVSTSYEEDSDKVIALLKEVGQEVRNDALYKEDIVADPEVPGIERVAPGEVDYLLLVKTKPGAQYTVTRELRRRIKAAFEKNNIRPPAPAGAYVRDRGPVGQAQ